jgi:transposase-like protein
MTGDTAKQDALWEELLKGYPNPNDILREQGLLKHRPRRLVERVLEAEMTAPLGYAPRRRKCAAAVILAMASP